MEQLALAKIIMKVNALPSLPMVSNRVIMLTNDSRSTSAEISSAICQDQVLASKVLRLVNSAFYGLPRKISTITESISILGMQTLRTLVLGASVQSVLSDFSNKRDINLEQIWRHAAATAAAAKILSSELGSENKESAFIAGLLHDIGIVILYVFLGKDYIDVLERAISRKCSVFEAEQEMMEITHTEIGKIVAEKWNLPKVLVDPIGFHHDPFTECENSELVQVVYLANIIANLAGYSAIGSMNLSINPIILEKFNVTYTHLCQISEKIKGTISINFL